MKHLISALTLSVAITAPALADTGSLTEYQPTLSDEFKTMLNSGTPGDGEMIFMRKCSSCHDYKQTGGHGKGPHLWNLFGRQAGTAEGFQYSEAMKTSGHTWDWATLNYYLTRTDRAVPGRAMNFRGIRDDEDRARLLLFLHLANDNPPSLP